MTVYTRDLIMERAYRLFMHHSFEAVSVNDIAKAVGCTKGALYHHFTNKEEIFQAVIDRYISKRDVVDLPSDVSLKEFLDEVIQKTYNVFMEFYNEEPSFLPVNYMALYIDAFRHYPSFAQEKEKLFKNEIEKITAIVSRAKEREEIREDVDSYLTALNFFSVSRTLVGNILNNSSPDDCVDLLKRQLMSIYDIIKK